MTRRFLTGRVFGNLKVVADGQVYNGCATCSCLCTCGRIIHVMNGNLISGNTTKCRSCASKIVATKHGGKGSPEYASWRSMRVRCSNSKYHAAHRYSGRGIRVCARWGDFAMFLEDMGERLPGTTLDRFPDRNGNYEPGNCRWATWVQQAQNRDKPCSKLEDATP